MTAFEKWVTEFAASLEKEDAEADPPRDMQSTLVQRIAIGLVQSRAAECRHISGELLLRNPGSQLAGILSLRLSDRSHKLEQIALEMCTKYPPDTPPTQADPKGMITLTGENRDN